MGAQNRLLRLVALLRVVDRSASDTLAGRAAHYVAGAGLAAVGLGALAVLHAERGAPGVTIVNYGDALWWATCTVTTVGYGHRYPVTLEGRLVAVILMLAGIGVVGTVTAAIASWFVEHSQPSAPRPDATTPRPRRGDPGADMPA